MERFIPYSSPDVVRTRCCNAATGFLLAAIPHIRLEALTHTASPMIFHAKMLGKRANERPFLLIHVGHLAEDAIVPNLMCKSLSEMSVFL